MRYTSIYTFLLYCRFCYIRFVMSFSLYIGAPSVFDISWNEDIIVQKGIIISSFLLLSILFFYHNVISVDLLIMNIEISKEVLLIKSL